jgi:polyhydroxybutyrate depolymerase
LQAPTLARSLTAFLVAALTMTGAVPTQAQDGTLRERLRERLQQRQTSQPEATRGPDAATALAGPGDHTYSLDRGGLRKYLVHVPRNYDPAVPTPVLMAFHGGGGHMALQADDARYGLISKSESAGFIAVFPNGYSPWPGGRLATWNAGACCAAARDQHIDDVGFVRAIVAELPQRFNVDVHRIYATGMSNGGMLTHRLACEMADVFKAIAPVAGTDNTLSCSPSRPISVIEFHARDDDHVLFNGGAGAGAFRDESKVADFTSVPETIARWTRRNGCTAAPTRVLDKPGAYCERRTGCRDGVAVQLCVTDTGGHSWPGAGTVRSGKAAASQALDADDVMWAFFSQLP